MTGNAQSPYLDPSLPLSIRVSDALDRLSLEEKVAQITTIAPRKTAADRDPLVRNDGSIDETAARRVFRDGCGQITRPADVGLDPDQTAIVTQRLQEIVREESTLGIPAIQSEEALSGYMGRGGTIYPQSIGLASTWNPGLIETMAGQIQRQMRAVGARQALSPVLDVGRDPRWGRTEETYGEDPYLVATMGSAYVRGLQGDDPRTGVSAMLKHFGAHGIGEGGKNRSAVQIGQRELREVHLFPFEAVIKATDADSVMTAYHAIDGAPCTADESLLTGILREEWGFDGTVVSDGSSIRFLIDEHHVARDGADAAIQAIEAGTDVEMTGDCYYNLVDSVETGDVSEATIDTAVARVLRQKFRKGLLEDRGPDYDPEEVFGPDANRDLARKLARESVTLLKNAGDLLPLSEEQSIAVVGPLADAPNGQLGDYAYPAHHDVEADREIVTPLTALRDRFGEESVAYAAGCSTTGPSTAEFDAAVTVAEDADVTLAFVGAHSAIALGAVEPDRDQRPNVPTSGEGADVTDLGLPGVQQYLVEAVHETDTPLVVVQISGKPHSIEWIDDHVPAILHAWLPGEEGGTAIADVLFGEHTPSGHLPISIPKSVGQLPVYYSRRPNSREERHVYEDSDPLYPFGH
ncbi:MAG: glycoside hydrolase family 3 protein, partial [archaeon]